MRNKLLFSIVIIFFVFSSLSPQYLGASKQGYGSEYCHRMDKLMKYAKLTFHLKDGRVLELKLAEPFNTYKKRCETPADLDVFHDHNDLRVIDGLFAVIPCLSASLAHSGNDLLIQGVCNGGMEEVAKTFGKFIRIKHYGKVSAQQLCYTLTALAKKADYQQYRKFVVFMSSILKDPDKGLTEENLDFLFPSEKFVSSLTSHSQSKLFSQIKAMGFLVARILQNSKNPNFFFKEKNDLLGKLVFDGKFEPNKYVFPESFLYVYAVYEDGYLRIILKSLSEFQGRMKP